MTTPQLPPFAVKLLDLQERARPILLQLAQKLAQRGVPLERSCFCITAHSRAPDRVDARAFDIDSLNEEDLRDLVPVAAMAELLAAERSPRTLTVLYMLDNTWCVSNDPITDQSDLRMVDFTANPTMPSADMFRLANIIYDQLCSFVRDEVLVKRLDLRDHVVWIDTADSTLMIVSELLITTYLTEVCPSNQDRKLIECVANSPKSLDTIRAVFLHRDECCVGVVSLPQSLISTAPGGSA